MIPGGIPGLTNSGTMGDIGGSAGPSTAQSGPIGVNIGSFNPPSWAPSGGVNVNQVMLVVGAVVAVYLLTKKR